MKIAVIADDLTGAGDTGVQFAKRGLEVSVLLQVVSNIGVVSERDVLILDTDSRSLDAESAYRTVMEASRCAKAFGADVIFKKIDSTLRGNLGSEIDAVYDVFRPDFVVIAPAFPEAGRLVREGTLYVHGTPLHETEFANDPKAPVTDSYIPELLRKQTKHSVETIPAAILAKGSGELERLLRSCKSQGICYLLVDSVDGEDLRRIVSLMGETTYSVVWAGSAGLASQLSAQGPSMQHPATEEYRKPDRPILVVIGSVSLRSRCQLEILLDRSDVRGIQLEAYRLLTGHPEREQELAYALEKAELTLQANLHPVLYSSGDREAIRLAQDTGARIGMIAQEVSSEISRALGEAASRLLERVEIGGIIMTGGDTARQVCSSLQASEFRLIGEVESGVPIGLLAMDIMLPAVTKAGGFGSDQALIHALEALIGGIGRK